MHPGSPLPRCATAFAICGLVVIGIALPGNLSAQSDAKALYDTRCASCHGAGGAGDGAAARAIKTPMPKFSDSAYAAARTDDQLNASITNGKAPMMPAFGKQLKPEQIRDLVAYIRQFRQPPAQ